MWPARSRGSGSCERKAVSRSRLRRVPQSWGNPLRRYPGVPGSRLRGSQTTRPPDRLREEPYRRQPGEAPRRWRQTIAIDLRGDRQRLRSCGARFQVTAVQVNVERSRYVTQVLMYKLDGDRAFAHAGCDPFHRAIANVTHREDTGNICLQQAWIAVQRPALGPLAGLQQIRAGQDKPAFVSLHGSVQPGRARFGPDENEQRIRRHAVHAARGIADDGDKFQAIFPMHLYYARAVFDVDVGGGLDLLD